MAVLFTPTSTDEDRHPMCMPKAFYHTAVSMHKTTTTFRSIRAVGDEKITDIFTASERGEYGAGRTLTGRASDERLIE